MLKLDIGCGGRGSRQAGFIGIDLWPRPKDKTEEEYFILDFTKDPLPWGRNSVDEAIALHIIEHLLPEAGQRLVTRAVELLKPESKLTITCPDLALLARKYLEHDVKFFEKKYNTGKLIWQGPTLADRLNWAIHQEGHQWSYDLSSLMALAERAVALLEYHVTIEPLPIDSHWWTRRDHETGIQITKK